MKIHLLWQNYRYFPYEREFAKKEVQSLTGQQPLEDASGLTVDVKADWKRLAKRMTYFREVLSNNGSRVVPLQTQLEVVSNGSFMPPAVVLDDLLALTRQSTRYSCHGLHEYNGKFNPQVVRAISNILGLQPGEWILDPFCGCGTALLEAFHLRMNAVGIDLNPLGVEIANAKIAAMQVPNDQLLEQVAILKMRLLERIGGLQFDTPFTTAQIRQIVRANWQSRVNCPDYLRLWFTESVLVQFAAIMDEIDRLPSTAIRTIMRVVLSDIVREVSLQDANDLRIRRRKSPPENEPAIPLFLDSLSKKLSCILKARPLIQASNTTQVAIYGSALHCKDVIAKNGFSRRKLFNAAITSPPYATALPYIDTQRLSLVLLGLIDSRGIRAAEKCLIGNREISPPERTSLEKALADNTHHLPLECVSFCKTLRDAVNTKSDGFRRRNVPGLLYKYMAEMAEMFRQVRAVLRKGGRYALIIGKNNTRLGGRLFTIDTPHLLTLLAKANGFQIQEYVAMDTYHRFNVHHANSIRAENLIILEKGA